jgi:hypothetical protein
MQKSTSFYPQRDEAIAVRTPVLLAIAGDYGKTEIVERLSADQNW